MNLNRFFFRCSILFWTLCALGPVWSEEHPNVVVFLADDAGWGDYSQNGNETVKTPNIDSIARDGATIDRFFVCPVCAPTRAEFLTGRYHMRSGVYGVSTGQERMSIREKTIADSFRAAGYKTGAFGKWHNGSQWPYHPMARGFDEFYGYTAGHWGEYVDPLLEHNGKPVRAEGYIVDRCTDQAIEFIDRHRSEPFLCYIPFTTPHSPWSVPNEYWDRFRDRSLAQSASIPANEKQDETRCALAMMENQDWNVGRVLRKLESLHLSDKTIVLYFSDNGPNGARWNGGMKGTKGTTDEGGIRSTCFVRYPNHISAGKVIHPIAGAIDLLPTLTSLAGVTRVGSLPLDGKDLTPLLLKEKVDWPERSLFSIWGTSVSVRTQTHRLDTQGRLFDMTRDPGQLDPVQSQHADLAASLGAALRSWKTEMLAELESHVPQMSRGKKVDPRPILLGYSEFPRTWLPARDGIPTGQIERSAPAPNSSYFIGWTRVEDQIRWEVDIQKGAEYEVTLDYTCPLEDVGSEVELSFRDANDQVIGSKLIGKVEQGWDPPHHGNQDTLPRPKAESPWKNFRTLSLGKIRLENGRGTLVLQATKVPGQMVMHLSAMTLTLK